MEFTIDFNSSEAIYMQLRNQVIMAIAQDKLNNGENLPSVRQLADDLGVNMHTVNKAYSILKQEGYLKLDRRTGAIVSVEPKNKFYAVQEINSNIKMIIAEAICKDVSLEEMQKIVSEMYDLFSKLED